MHEQPEGKICIMDDKTHTGWLHGGTDKLWQHVQSIILSKKMLHNHGSIYSGLYLSFV